MARIKINDLPRDTKISREEMKQVFGGLLVSGTTSLVQTSYLKIDGDSATTIEKFYYGSTLYKETPNGTI